MRLTYFRARGSFDPPLWQPHQSLASTGCASTCRSLTRPHRQHFMPSPEKSFVEDGAVWGRLELSMTPGESTVYELRGNQSQVIGRASGCELQVDLPHISGSHCTVRPSGTSEVTDHHSNLGPTDGTDPLMGLDSKPGPTVFALCSVRRASTAPRSWTSPPMARASTASPSAGRTAGPKQRPLLSARAHLQGAPGSSGWLGAHRGETGPLGAQPLPRVLELAATEAADVPVSDHAGGTRRRDASARHDALRPEP